MKKLVITSENIKFLKKINELADQDITLCEQCGTCSGSCPMVADMDITPSQIMRMVQLGDLDVLNSKAIWVCASCYSCTVRCPRNLDVSKVAEALRQVYLRKALDYVEIKKIPKYELVSLPQIAIVSACRKFTG